MSEVSDHSVSKERFSLCDCLTCGFRATEPPPSLEAITKYYESDDYISHTNSKKSLLDRLYQIARKSALRGKQRIIRHYHQTGSVLDFGCGTGEFLAHMRTAGYRVHGVEPGVKARKYATSEHHLRVSSSLDDPEVGSEYDIITLWHVLEHLHEPRHGFQKLSSLLARGGLLFIAVPDRDCWDCSHYGAFWAAWDVPRHLSHFRQKDIEKLVADHRLMLVAKRRMYLDAPYVCILSEKYLSHGKAVALLKGALLGLLSNALAMFFRYPSSSTLFIIRKP